MIDYKSLLQHGDIRGFFYPEYKVGVEQEFYIFVGEEGSLKPICDIESGEYPQKKYQIKSEYKDLYTKFCYSLAGKLDIAEVFLLNPQDKTEDKIFTKPSSNNPEDFIEQEYGCSQFEVSFAPNASGYAIANEVEQFRTIASEAAEALGLYISFAAKPVYGQAGSATHIHISFYDAIGSNVFANNNKTIEHAVAGLLLHAQDNIELYYNNKDTIARLEPNFDSPIKLCWGANNRTVAIRQPETAGQPQAKRIENRLPSANCNIAEVIYKSLVACDEGIRKQLNPPQQVFGNANDEQYKFFEISSIIKQRA